MLIFLLFLFLKLACSMSELAQYYINSTSPVANLTFSSIPSLMPTLITDSEFPTINTEFTYLFFAPEVESASFSEDGYYVYLDFDVPCDNIGYVNSFPCDSYLSFPGIDFSTCQWYNTTRLMITIGSAPIMVGYNSSLIIYNQNLLPACSMIDENSLYFFNYLKSIEMDKSNDQVISQIESNNYRCIAQSNEIRGDSNIKIQKPNTIQPPTIVISAPSVVDSCSSVLLDLSASYGNCGRVWEKINISVSATSSIESSLNFTDLDMLQKSVRLIQDLVSYIHYLSPPILIPDSLLVPNSIYIFCIELCNFLDSCSVDFYSLNVVPDKGEKPVVSIHGLQERSIYRKDELFLTASAYTQTCQGNISHNDLKYTWYLSLSNGTIISNIHSQSKSVSQFYLPSFMLQSDTSYIVSLYVQSTERMDTIVNEYTSSIASVLVHVLVSSIVAEISGGKNLTILESNVLLLDGSNSYDPDVQLTSLLELPTKINENLVFIWSIAPKIRLELHSQLSYQNQTSSCLLETSIDKSSNSNALASIYAPLSSIGMSCVVSLTVYRKSTFSNKSIELDSYYGTTQVTLLVVESLNPIISIYVPKSDIATSLTAFNTHNSLTLTASLSCPSCVESCYPQWMVDDQYFPLANVSLTPLISTTALTPYKNLLFSLILDSNSFPPTKSTYTFSIHCNDAFASLTLTTNQPPIPGVFSLSPTYGTAISTNFIFLVARWIDTDLPLTYEFSYIPPTSNTKLIIQSNSEIRYGSTLLPLGLQTSSYLIECQALISDSFFSSTKASYFVTVNKTVDFSRDELQAYYLNKIESALQLANVGYVNSLKQNVAILSASLNLLNCSTAPDCSALNRNPCSSRVNTCGKCLPGYIDASGEESNQLCITVNKAESLYEKAQMLSTVKILDSFYTEQQNIQDIISLSFVATCFNNTDCLPSWEKCSQATFSDLNTSISNQKKGFCVPISKTCSNDCTLHGTCIYLTANVNINSESLFYDSSNCSLWNSNCITKCQCDKNYIGQDCEVNIIDLSGRQNLRTSMLSAISNLTLLEDSKKDNIINWISNLQSITQNAIEISSFNHTSFTTFLIELLMASKSHFLDSNNVVPILMSLDSYLSGIQYSYSSSISPLSTLQNSTDTFFLSKVTRILCHYLDFIGNKMQRYTPDSIDYLGHFFKITSKSSSESTFDDFNLESPKIGIQQIVQTSSIVANIFTTQATDNQFIQNATTKYPTPTIASNTQLIACAIFLNIFALSITGDESFISSSSFRRYESEAVSIKIYNQSIIDNKLLDILYVPLSVDFQFSKMLTYNLTTLNYNVSHTKFVTSCRDSDFTENFYMCPDSQVILRHNCTSKAMMLSSMCPVVQYNDTCSTQASFFSSIEKTCQTIEDSKNNTITCRCRLTSYDDHNNGNSYNDSSSTTTLLKSSLFPESRMLPSPSVFNIFVSPMPNLKFSKVPIYFTKSIQQVGYDTNLICVYLVLLYIVIFLFFVVLPIQKCKWWSIRNSVSDDFTSSITSSKLPTEPIFNNDNQTVPENSLSIDHHPVKSMHNIIEQKNMDSQKSWIQMLSTISSMQDRLLVQESIVTYVHSLIPRIFTTSTNSNVFKRILHELIENHVYFAGFYTYQKSRYFVRRLITRVVMNINCMIFFIVSSYFVIDSIIASITCTPHKSQSTCMDTNSATALYASMHKDNSYSSTITNTNDHYFLELPGKCIWDTVTSTCQYKRQYEIFPQSVLLYLLIAVILSTFLIGFDLLIFKYICDTISSPLHKQSNSTANEDEYSSLCQWTSKQLQSCLIFSENTSSTNDISFPVPFLVHTNQKYLSCRREIELCATKLGMKIPMVFHSTSDCIDFSEITEPIEVSTVNSFQNNLLLLPQKLWHCIISVVFECQCVNQNAIDDNDASPHDDYIRISNNGSMNSDRDNPSSDNSSQRIDQFYEGNEGNQGNENHSIEVRSATVNVSNSHVSHSTVPINAIDVRFQYFINDLKMQRRFLKQTDLLLFDSSWYIDSTLGDFNSTYNGSIPVNTKHINFQNPLKKTPKEIIKHEMIQVIVQSKKQHALLKKSDLDVYNAEVLLSFIRDLLGRNTTELRIFSLKLQEDNHTIHSVTVRQKSVAIFLFGIVNVLFVIVPFVLLGKNRNIYRFLEFLIGFSCQLVLEIFVVETVRCIWMNVVIPSLASDTIQAAVQCLHAHINSLCGLSHYTTTTTSNNNNNNNNNVNHENASNTNGTLFSSYSSVESNSLDSAVVIFNSSSYFFVSSILSKFVPWTLEHALVQRHESMMPHSNMFINSKKNKTHQSNHNPDNNNKSHGNNNFINETAESNIGDLQLENMDNSDTTSTDLRSNTNNDRLFSSVYFHWIGEFKRSIYSFFRLFIVNTLSFQNTFIRFMTIWFSFGFGYLLIVLSTSPSLTVELITVITLLVLIISMGLFWYIKKEIRTKKQVMSENQG